MTKDEIEEMETDWRPLTDAQIEGIESLLRTMESTDMRAVAEMAIRGVLVACIGSDCPINGLALDHEIDAGGNLYWKFTDPASRSNVPGDVNSKSTRTYFVPTVRPGLHAAAFFRGCIYGATKGTASPEVVHLEDDGGDFCEVHDEGQPIFRTGSFNPSLAAQAFTDGCYENM